MALDGNEFALQGVQRSNMLQCAIVCGCVVGQVGVHVVVFLNGQCAKYSGQPLSMLLLYQPAAQVYYFLCLLARLAGTLWRGTFTATASWQPILWHALMPLLAACSFIHVMHEWRWPA